MSAFPSPYKEFGMLADAKRVNKRKPARLEPDIYGRAPKSARDGHSWHLMFGKLGSAKFARRDVCRHCGRPKFLVDGKKCRGRRGKRR